MCSRKGSIKCGVCSVFDDPNYDALYEVKEVKKIKQEDSDIIARDDFNWRQAAMDSVARISAKYPSKSRSY